MIRQMAVRPDQTFLTTEDQEIAVVSREAMREALLDLEPILFMLGGGASIQTYRANTGVEHEMVTVLALVRWQDQPFTKPKPEPVAVAAAEPERSPRLQEVSAAEAEQLVAEAEAAVAQIESPEPEEAPVEYERLPEPTDPELAAARHAEPGDDDIIRGERPEDDEDVSSIPRSKRELVG